MLSSRGLMMYRMLSKAPGLKNQLTSNGLQSVRHGSYWSYRLPATIRPRINLYADLVGGVMFWWILWHCWHDYGHIIGEFDYPDPALWTNEELGIPPDNAE